MKTTQTWSCFFNVDRGAVNGTMATSRRRRSQQHGASDEQLIGVTDFADRSHVLLEMSQADQQRADALGNVRLALAELSARIASAEVDVSPSKAASPDPEVMNRSIAALKRHVHERTLQLRELRGTLLTQSTELERLQQALMHSDDAMRLIEQLPSPPGKDRGPVGESLAHAVRTAHLRLSSVMGDVDDLHRRSNDDGAAGSNAKGNAAHDADMRAAHDNLRHEIEQYHREIRMLKQRLDELSRERTALEAVRSVSPNRAGSATGNSTSAVFSTEAARLQALRAELDRCRAQQSQLQKIQWAFLVSQPNTGLRAVNPMEKVREAMAFLKSTVIHFGQDLRKIHTVLRQAAFDKEQVFKQAHNEIKIVVGLMLPKEDQLAFQRSRDEPWPVTEQLIRSKFPAHKLDTSYSALQEMVVSWDAMSEEERQRLTTAHDVVNNAEVLYLMARYIAFEWREKRTAMKQRAGGVASM
jgi:hypothetical protein